MDQATRNRIVSFIWGIAADVLRDLFKRGKVMQLLLKDATLAYKQFVENELFQRFVGDMVYALTSR